MPPESPRSQSTVTRFRRDYFVASILPLLGFFLLVLIGVTITRDEIAHLVDDSTRELNQDAEKALQQLGETVIRTKARDVAAQLSVYFRMHPGLGLDEMREDPFFMELAIQTVGKTGYTALSDTSDSYLIRVHPNPDLINFDMRNLRETRPDWWKIVELGIFGVEAEGYYDWEEPDGTIRKKYLVATPVDVSVDGVTIMVSATTYIDEFSAPVVAMHSRAGEIVEQYQSYVSQQWKAFILVFAVVLLATVTSSYMLGTRAARRFIDPIAQLARAVREFGEGQWSTSGLQAVVGRQDEIGTLARTFQRLSAQIVGLFGSLERRVTELDVAQAALKESEDHYRQLYEATRQTEAIYRSLIHSSADAIVMTDLDLNVTYLSPAFTQIFGWTEEELIGRNLPYVPPAESTRTMDILGEVVSKGVPCRGNETRRLTKDGRLIDVSISASRFDDHEGNPAGMLAILRDISESKRVEAQMQRIDRLEAIGTLAGGVAHDFNNLLMVVQGNVSLMKSTLPPDDENQQSLVEIEEQIQSGAHLTNQLLGYARKGRYEVEVADLNELVTKTSQTVGRTRKDVVFHYDLATDLLPVEADFHQIEQVLLNLSINACDAMPDGGEVRISTRNVRKGATPMVLLSVQDDGTGMDQQTMDHVFDPFFTTKAIGRGTGLGLASAYGIVEAHGGSITVTSELGHGATFSVYLPATDKPLITHAGAAEALSPGHGTILLIDDEDKVLEVCADLMRHLGYDVLSARGGPEALEIFRDRWAEIDLVVLDMIMPGMSGATVFDRLKEIDPDVAIVLSTGYSIDTKAMEILTRGCRGHIQKPYTLTQLGQKLSAALRPQ